MFLFLQKEDIVTVQSLTEAFNILSCKMQVDGIAA